MSAPVKLTVATATDPAPLSDHTFTKDLITIGRTAANDVVLPDVEKRVSSKHAQIERKGGAWTVTDLGSTNGTFLNDKKIEPRTSVALKSGDCLGCGVFRLRFVVEEEPADQTIVHVDPSRQAAKISDEVTAVYARHLTSTPEQRLNAVKDVMRAAMTSVPKDNARAVFAQIRSRFERGAQGGGGGGGGTDRSTMVRKRDFEIQRQEELYQSGFKAVNNLSSHFVGDTGFETSEQVELFGKQIENVLNATLQWLSNALKGRREFENQFSADLTLVFSKEGNPIKTAAAPTDIGKFLLDWHKEENAVQSKNALEGAFKDLTMHQLGLLAGVQEALKAALQRLDPKNIETQAGTGGVFSKAPNFKKAWEIYGAKHKEMFEENSKLFNEVIYPSIRKGYLASHAGEGGGASDATPSKPLTHI
jgi:predicted component of type VI protein secretion system